MNAVESLKTAALGLWAQAEELEKTALTVDYGTRAGRRTVSNLLAPGGIARVKQIIGGLARGHGHGPGMMTRKQIWSAMGGGEQAATIAAAAAPILAAGGLTGRKLVKARRAEKVAAVLLELQANELADEIEKSAADGS